MVSFSIIVARVPQKEVTNLIMGLCFIVSISISSHYENKLKNWIAIETHYFSDPEPFKSNKIEPLITRDIYNHHNYQISLSNQWVKKTDKGHFFPYYYFINDINKMIELRPGCLQNNDIAITDIVNNINMSLNSNTKTLQRNCYAINKNEVACSLSELDTDGVVERIRWYSLNTEYNYGIALDFVLLQKQNKVPDEVISVIKNARNNNTKFDSLECVSLAEWM